MNIFLTGGTGFIGSNFIEHALSEGHTIFAIRRRGSFPKIKLTQQPIWIEGDLNSNFDDYFEKSDALIHLAAYGLWGLNELNWEKAIECNILFTLKLFEQAHQKGVDKFLVTGSCFEYGKSAEKYEKIPSTAPLEPIDVYSSTKAAASLILRSWAIEKNVKFHLMRLFQVYGAGEADHRLLPSLINAAKKGLDFEMTNGEQIRDFIDVKKVSELILKSISNDSIKFGEPLITNVGTGIPTTVLSFCRQWWSKLNAKSKLLPGKIKYRSDEIMRLVPEIESKNILKK